MNPSGLPSGGVRAAQHDGAPLALPSSIDWGVQALWERLAPLLPGLTIEVVARVDSTNSELLRRVRAQQVTGDEGADTVVRPSIESRAFGRRAADLLPCLLIAEHQFAGRGRQGRNWESAAGASLTFSLILPLPIADWSGLSLAVGVAVCEAVAALDPDPDTDHRHGLRCAIKWPNDLWLVAAQEAAPTAAGRKLGGILVETVAAGAGTQRLVVVGVGLNVLPLHAAATGSGAGAGIDAASTPGASTGALTSGASTSGAPTPGSSTSGASTSGASKSGALTSGFASLSEIDPGASVATVLARVAPALVDALHQFQREGFGGFVPRFDALDLLRNQRVTTTHEQAPQGIARGITASGGLRVETPLGTVEVTSGEVSVRIATEASDRSRLGTAR